MGACSFSTVARGASVRAAFDDARHSARSDMECDPDYDGDPSAGSIAAKGSYTMIPLPTGVDASDPIACHDAAQKLIDDQDRRIDDKWGPAGCFDLGGGRFLFFGWAPE